MSLTNFIHIALYIQMVFARLLRTKAVLASFRARFDIPLDVDIEYCHEGNIENDRRPRVVFFPSMAVLEGELDFPWTLYYLEQLVSTAFPLTNFHQISIEW